MYSPQSKTILLLIEDKVSLPSESDEHWEQTGTFELLSVLLLNVDSVIKSRFPFWTCSSSRLFTLEESDSDGLGL